MKPNMRMKWKKKELGWFIFIGKMILLFQFIGWNDICYSFIRLDNEHFVRERIIVRKIQGLLRFRRFLVYRVVFKHRPTNFFSLHFHVNEKKTSQLNIRRILVDCCGNFEHLRRFYLVSCCIRVLRSVKIARESNARCWRMSFIRWATQRKTTPNLLCCARIISPSANFLFTISLILDFTDLSTYAIPSK